MNKLFLKKILIVQLSSVKLITMVSLYFSLILNLAFYRGVYQSYNFSGTWADSFIYTMPLTLFFACNLIFGVLTLPFLHKVIIPTLILLSAAISYYSLFFNVYFDLDMLNNVLHTDLAESSRLASFSYLVWLFFFGIVPAVGYVYVKIDYRPWWKEVLQRVGFLLISVLGILAIAAFSYQSYAAFFRNNKFLPHLIVPSNFIAASTKKVKRLQLENMPFTEIGQDIQPLKKDDLRNVSVIVVGETTRAQNWGLNGYSRQTTPKLAARGQQVVNFPEVRSCGTSTAVSVPCMFSLQTQATYNEIQSRFQSNLVDMLKKAGIEVYWLENNGFCRGVCERAIFMSVKDFGSPEFCQKGECLDNILLPELDNILAKNVQQDVVVILHTMGSHGPTYYERYTEAERLFTPTCDTNELNHCSDEELINTYDNGIVYIDQFLDKIITRLEAQPEWKSSLFYLSDHGESLGEKGLYLHGAPYAIAPDTQTKVPMVMWFSPAFQQHKALDLACLHRQATQPYRHDHFFHTVLGLVDVNLNVSVYDKALDVTAPCRKRLLP